jgi:hypothetical protein
MAGLSPQIESQLTSIIRSGRLANAYCLSGDDLPLKLNVARYILKGLVPHKSDHALIDEGRFYGFIHILTDEGSHKIEAMRNLRRQVIHQSGDAWMAIFIEKAHKLTLQAANSLLKVFEEPPENVVFFLDSPMFQSLIPTIRSRSQNISLGFSGSVDIEVPPLFDISYDRLLNEIRVCPLTEWLILIESTKLDRHGLQDMLRAWADVLRGGGSIKALEVIMQNVGYLDRPVNVQSLLMLLVMNLRELP